MSGSERRARAVAVVLLLAAGLVAPVVDVSSAAAATTVTGNVFQDFNSDGTKSTAVKMGVAVDTGVAGVTVRAFGTGGELLSQTVSAANGDYSLDVTAAGAGLVRVEFSIPTTDPALADFRPSFATATGASGSSTG
ncbi:MAG: hypothetical protein ACKO04_14950, partial [Actinomycetes bacterium]